ncbi:MAG: mucoidy inhibitor MuiA family protein [Spirochaetota bacterium]
MIIKSGISAVTVYNDRAEVTRTASENLDKGEHVLIFDFLPEYIEPNSVQVRGSGNAMLKDVKFKTVYYEELPDPNAKLLFDEKLKLAEAISELDDKIAHAEKEKGFIEDIAKRLTVSTGKSEAFEFNPDKWIKMVEFYRIKNDELDKEIRAANKEKNILKNKMEKILKDIAAVGSTREKSKNQVEASVLMNGQGALILDLIYIVYGPSWAPVYDLRVSTDSKSMNISYHALIQQNTQEDWNDVDLKLSTARPNISGNQPELTPWHISVYQPDLFRNAPSASLAKEKKAAAPARQMFDEEASRIADMDSVVGGMPAIAPAEATVETGATSVLFAVGGKSTIGSGSDQHKVTILRKDFSAYFRYSSVPKLAQFAYLKAKVKNETEYPLLPGESNIFLDNNFVANSYMKLAAPGEEFWTFLGVDEGMKIEYKFINKYEATEGVFSKTSKLMYEYQIIIKNNKKSEADVVVWDQIPISGNEEIKVTLIEPEYKKDSDSLKINENKYLEWLFKPKPAQEIKVQFKFSVEYPKNIVVSGL